MSQPMKEQLSAMADGELGSEPSRFVLKAMAGDDALRATWARYHIAREVMHGSGTAIASTDFAERVAAAVETEPAPAQVRPRRSAPRWMRPAAGAAVAASVAMASLWFVNAADPQPDRLVVDPRPVSNDAPAPEYLGVTPPPAPARTVSAPARTVSWGSVSASPRIDPRLNGYLIRHSRQAATFRGAGLRPYVYLTTISAPAAAESPSEASN